MSDATVTRTKFKKGISELVVNRGLSVKMYSENELVDSVSTKEGIKGFLASAHDAECFEMIVSNGQWLSFVNEPEGMELSDFTVKYLDIVNLFSKEPIALPAEYHFRITTDNYSTWGLYSDTIEGAIEESNELVKCGNVGAIIKDMTGKILRKKLTGVDGWTVVSN